MVVDEGYRFLEGAEERCLPHTNVCSIQRRPSPAPIVGYSVRMNDESRPDTDEIEGDIEAAIDDKRAGVLAADATGMVSNEEFIRVVELREGELTPPA